MWENWDEQIKKENFLVNRVDWVVKKKFNFNKRILEKEDVINEKKLPCHQHQLDNNYYSREKGKIQIGIMKKPITNKN